jgi:endonuclease/exonuclease/phosphatase family metal-dependent hydrolase
MAGDFNLEEPQMHDVWDSFNDLVTSPTQEAPNPTRRIDHIFVDRRGVTVHGTPYCPSNASDHCHTSGEWAP